MCISDALVLQTFSLCAFSHLIFSPAFMFFWRCQWISSSLFFSFFFFFIIICTFEFFSSGFFVFQTSFLHNMFSLDLSSMFFLFYDLCLQHGHLKKSYSHEHVSRSLYLHGQCTIRVLSCIEQHTRNKHILLLNCEDPTLTNICENLPERNIYHPGP